MNEEMDLHVFVIDTDSYAGSFERELCAYITGSVGEHGVGQRYANLYHTEVEQDLFAEERFITDIPDDSGCLRPCSIWTNPNWRNAGEFKYERVPTQQSRSEVSLSSPAHLSVAIYFEKEPTPEMVRLMIQRAHQFVGIKGGGEEFDSYPKTIEGFRVLKRIIHYKEIISIDGRSRSEADG